MKNKLQNRVLPTLCIAAALFAASTSLQAGEWGSGDKGKNAGQKTRDTIQKAYESSRTCAKEFGEGYQNGQSGKSTCESAGVQTRKIANEAKSFVNGLFGKR